MPDEVKTGERIMLGADFKRFVLPNGKELPIRRMGMRNELLFVDLYNEFQRELSGMKDDVLAKIKDAMGGTVRVGLVEGMELVGQVLAQLPRLQNFMKHSVQVIAKAQNIEITTDELDEHLSTADCYAVLCAQAEVQGLLGSFRAVLAGLGAASSRNG